jgi:hypothetical protein
MFKPHAPSALATSTGTGSANLLTAEPKEVWAAASVGSVNIDIDFGSTVSLDSFFVGFTNASSGATWTITGGSSYTANTYKNSGGFPASSGRTNPRQHGFYMHGSTISARFIRLAITQTGASALQIGIASIGKAFEPTWNMEWEAGRIPIDTGTRSERPDGGFGVEHGAIKHGFKWTLGDLTESDLAILDDLMAECGETYPVIIVEDPASTSGLNERLHYGLFDRLEQWQRRSPDRTRWGLSMREWV